MTKNYTITTYANGFGVWHATAYFPIALGNTGEAQRIAYNALRACKRAIRREITERMNPTQCKRLSYQVKDNIVTPAIGTLRSITISEV
jgi:ribosome-binding factor A